MSGSIYGNLFKISTWGESHGKGLGVVIDGCPAGIPLCEEDIQTDLDRRKPGSKKFATKRVENDTIEILSGVFEGKTTGTPISLILYNKDQRSYDYGNIKDVYRPGHADYGFDMKYGFRDYRGSGRASGRETSARVAAGAVAKKILTELGVSVQAYTIQIGEIKVHKDTFDINEMYNNELCMPDKNAYEKASVYLQQLIDESDSSGGMAECIVKGLKAGIGEPVFDKLDAHLAKAIVSVGAVKGIEFGAGFLVPTARGSINNDPFNWENGKIGKLTNNAGGILGGISDGSDIIFRVPFKPTSSIFKNQKTANKNGENIEITIEGRHDPLIVARATVVIEAMTAIALVDSIFMGLTSKIDTVKKAYFE